MSEKSEETTVTFPGTATDKDVDKIVNYPTDYGFKWNDTWDAASQTDKDGKRFGALVVLREKCATIPEVTDVKLFAESFGWQQLTDAYNGTSGRVKAQGISRELLLAEWDKQHAKNVSEKHIRSEVVKRVLLGMRAKGGGGGARAYYVVNGVKYANEADAIAASKVKVTYKGLDGKEYATGLEAKQASVAYLTHEDRGEARMAPAIAAMVVANMPE